MCFLNISATPVLCSLESNSVFVRRVKDLSKVSLRARTVENVSLISWSAIILALYCSYKFINNCCLTVSLNERTLWVMILSICGEFGRLGTMLKGSIIVLIMIKIRVDGVGIP